MAKKNKKNLVSKLKNVLTKDALLILLIYVGLPAVAFCLGFSCASKRDGNLVCYEPHKTVSGKVIWIKVD